MVRKAEHKEEEKEGFNLGQGVASTRTWPLGSWLELVSLTEWRLGFQSRPHFKADAMSGILHSRIARFF